jgi:hypothetical protein
MIGLGALSSPYFVSSRTSGVVKYYDLPRVSIALVVLCIV